MVEIEDASSVEILHHEKIAVVAPVFYLDLALGRFFHAVHEHASEMLTLSSQDCLVAVDWLVLHHENHICKSWVIYDGTHVSD